MKNRDYPQRFREEVGAKLDALEVRIKVLTWERGELAQALLDEHDGDTASAGAIALAQRIAEEGR